MASRTRSGSKAGRRIFWLAVSVIVVGLAYTGTWIYLARHIEARAAGAIAALNSRDGTRAFCEEPSAQGYPFRIGLECRSVFFESRDNGVSVRAGAFRSAAQVYQPYHVVGELDGPAVIVLPFADALEARWESLRASAQLGQPLPEQASMEANKLTVSLQEGEGPPLATAQSAQLHMRPAGEDIEAAANFRALTLGPQLVKGLPPVEGRVRATVNDGLELLKTGLSHLRGKSAVIHELVVGITDGEPSVALSGPVAVGMDGMIDADLSVAIQNASAVADYLSKAFPEAEDEIKGAATALGGLGGPIQLRIRSGLVFIGFIPLGRIPPVEGA